MVDFTNHAGDNEEERQEHPTVEKNLSRALRRHRDHTVELQQAGIARQHGAISPRNAVELGRYRKQHAMDCGRPQCGLCMSDRKKHAGIKGRTIQEKRQFDVLRDSLHPRG